LELLKLYESISIPDSIIRLALIFKQQWHTARVTHRGFLGRYFRHAPTPVPPTGCIVINRRLGARAVHPNLHWLDDQLSNCSDRPTFIALHHPPFRTGAPWLDSSRLQNPEALFGILDRHPQVKLVLFGHIHQSFMAERQGVTYLGCPSTCIQFLPRAAKFTLEPIGPGFRQLWLKADGTVRTQIQRVTIPLTLDFTSEGY